MSTVTSTTALNSPGPVVLHETGLDNGSAVSWPAIFAGAAGAAALSLILLLLGSGLGLAVVSPWARSGVAATTLGVSAIAWAAFTQVASAGLGGYLAGRLRGRWLDARGDEAYFRDTAHGFLAWAVATLATAALLGAAVSSVVGGAAQAGAAAVGPAAATALARDADDPGGAAKLPEGMAYAVDRLFRSPASAAAPAAAPAGVSAPTQAPAGAASQPGPPSPQADAAVLLRIVANAVRTGSLPDQDLKYGAELVAQRTGVDRQEAEKRVAEVHAQAQAQWNEAKQSAKEAADKARKATSYAALWLFVSLLAGAFVASVAALWGGRQRDL